MGAKEGSGTDPEAGSIPPSDDVIMNSTPSVADLVATQDAMTLAALQEARTIQAAHEEADRIVAA